MKIRLLLAASIAAPLVACATAPKAAPAGGSGTKAVTAAEGAPSGGDSGAAKDSAPAKEGTATRGPIASLKVPLMASSSASIPIAKVGDEIVRMDELIAALATSHESHSGGKPAARAFAPVLDRLIDARLLALEARAMGLDELPDVAKAIRDHEVKAVTDLLKEQIVRDVRHDAKAVDVAYKDAIKAPKVRALQFENAADATAASALLQAGRPFDEVASRAVAEKKATDDGKAEILPPDAMRPEVASALANAKAGMSTAPIPVEKGFAILHVEEIVFPDNPAKRTEIAKDSLAFEQNKALRAHYKELVAKFATVDKALLARLNFEAKKPGFEALAKDQRALVRIQNDDPMTVADLAQAMQAKFFHGIGSAIRDRKLNVLKAPLLDDLLARRMYLKDARAKHLDDTDAYRLEMTTFTTALLLSKLTEKAIAPDVKITESSVKAYYEQHQGDYMYPAFYGLEGISFRSKKAAQAALEKANAGTDLKWIRANAEEVVPPDDATVQFNGTPIASSMMPEELLKALQGTASGDHRLFEDGGQFYLLNVVSYTPPRPQEYKDCREPIAKKLFADEVGKRMKDWTAKLRAAQEVTVYLTDIGS